MEKIIKFEVKIKITSNKDTINSKDIILDCISSLTAWRRGCGIYYISPVSAKLLTTKK